MRSSLASLDDVARRVLIVDDDPAIRALVERLLTMEGYDVAEASGGPEAIDSIRREPPDLVLLDIVLPPSDGLDVLTELRQASEVPVILVSSRGDEADRVLGLRMGADDYVVKPFSAAELSARIESVLRRARTAEPSRRLVFPGLEIDLDTREVRLDGQPVDTPAKEFDLLVFLASSPRRVFSRGQILEHVWGSRSDWQSETTVTEHVSRLRRRLEPTPESPKWIATVRNVGYRFEPAPDR